jgi:radical SAM protein with 4Fe4S-binding SPASM domain
VVPCCLDADGIVALGNLLKEPLSDILSKERTLEMIKQFQNHCIKEELCRHCSYRKRFEE